jgi:ABC-2 type transport system ATP-binding protein
VIQVEHLSKDYGSTRALDDVSFEVERGEIVGLLGPNGAGKTTTMRILTGYIPPTEGAARIAGFDVSLDSIEVRRRIGYLPESVPLYPEMGVRRYLDYAASLRRVPDRRLAVQRALEACHIKDRADSLIGQLSKGLRQRVGLAQAILHDPQVLILDEPTIGLDPAQIIQVRELIRRLGQDRTIVLSSHILSEVSQTCGRVLIVHQGHLVAQGTPSDLTAKLGSDAQIQVRLASSTPNEEVQAALGAVQGVTGIQPLDAGAFVLTCAPGYGERVCPRVARAVVQRGWDLLEIGTARVSLEDLYLRLTVDEASRAARASADQIHDLPPYAEERDDA